MDVDPDPDKEDMEDARLDKKREHNWMMVFKDNDGVVEDEKVILHTKRWCVYMNDNK